MIEITFSNSINEVSAFGLTQWDKGQKLKIIWNNLPANFQVHFASRNSSEAIVVNAKAVYGSSVVEIPDELLKNSADIYAWIYATEGDKIGESIKKAVLYVRPRAKPNTLVDELEKTQQEILENILADITENIKSIKENGVDAQYLPDYVSSEAERVLAKVLDKQTDASVVFIASSDAHLKTGDYNSETGLKHMSQAMRLIAERYPVDFGAYLGDMTSGGSEKDIPEAENEIMKVNSALFPAYHTMPSFICAGSEDYLLNSYYRNGNYISDAELKKLIGKRNKDFYDGAYSERSYFYKDFAQLKIRVICLNTSDTFGQTLTPASETAVMSPSQLQWLCGSLDLSSKSDADKWGIILLGHHPLNMIGKFNLAVEVLNAYNKGASISKAVQSGETVVYNFAGKNSAKILGQFHGHLHSYKVGFITDKKIPVVCVPNASYYNNNFYSADTYTQQENQTYSDELTYNKRVNTAADTAFCVVVIDKVTGRIDAVHYGAGVDRVIVGDQVTYESSSSSGGTVPDPDDGGNTGGNTGGDDSGNTGGTTSYSYAIRVNGTTDYPATYTGKAQYSEHEEYKVSVQLNAGDTFVTYDLVNNAGWVMAIEPYGEYANFTAGTTSVTCNVAGCYDFYIKMMFQNDSMYIGPGSGCTGGGTDVGGNTGGNEGGNTGGGNDSGNTGGGLSTDYYLIGYIDGADYGSGETDWENLGDYKFVNGKVTATFKETSYVYVKTGDLSKWFMAEEYVMPSASGASGVLYATSANPAALEKIGVPAGTVTFTLKENADGTITLSYTMQGTTTNIEDITATNVTIYPNPTTGKASIVADQDVNYVVVRNLIGKTVATYNTKQMDISNLASSMYLVEIQFANGESTVQKLIKK